MPAPATIQEFLEVARKSGVVEEKRLEAYLQDLAVTSSMPAMPSQLAAELVRDGLLTQFQAEQLLLGKCRRFTIGDKYKLLERLGAGGMGSVYLCEHLWLRRRVALKILPVTRAEDPSALERFYREARAVAALNHPNIVRAYDVDREDQFHFLVMEYIDGSSLQEIVKKHGPTDIVRACHYICQAAQGLQHAHEAGWVHRDIKPGNVLVDRQGTVKILDMGLARFFDDSGSITKEHDETVLGTTDYLAPEQAIDGDVDIRADIYSLGATLYFMLAGRPPFTEGTIAQKLIWHQTRQPKSIRTVRPEVPTELAAVVEKMMAKDAAERFQTPVEVIEALSPWTQTAIAPPPEKEMPQLCPAARAMGQATTDSGRSAAQSPRTPAKAAHSTPCTPGSRPRFLTPPIIHTRGAAFVLSETPRPGPTSPASGSSAGPTTASTLVAGDPRPQTAEGDSSHSGRDRSTGEGVAFADTEEPAARADTKEVPRQPDDVILVHQEIRSFGGHRQAFPNVTFSPDDRLALTGSMRTTVPMWNVDTGKVIRRFAGHTDAVYAVSFSADGRRAVTGSFDKTVRLWDTDTGKEAGRFLGHEKGVWVVAFFPDGSRVLSAGEDQTARLWDVRTGQTLQRFSGHTAAIHSVAVAADGCRILTASRDKTVRLWNAQTGQTIRLLQGHTEPVYSVALAADGRHALSGGKDQVIRLWDVETGAILRSFAGHTDQVTCVAFSPDGRRVVSASFDATFRLWDAETGRELYRFVGHKGAIVSMAIAHDGQWILSGSMDQTIRLWQVPQ